MGVDRVHIGFIWCLFLGGRGEANVVSEAYWVCRASRGLSGSSTGPGPSVVCLRG